MGLKDTFHFDEQAYIKKIQDISQSTEYVLREKHRAKIRSIHSSSFDAGWGVVLVPMTAGASLIGTGYSLRQIQILARQAHLIEKEMARRGLPVPRSRPRDGIAGLTVGALGAGVGAGIDIGIGQLFHPVAANLSSAHAPGVADGISQAISNPGATAQDAFDGVHSLFEAHRLRHLAEPAALDSRVLQLPSNLAVQVGQHMGLVGTEAAEKLAAGTIAEGVTAHALEKV